METTSVSPQSVPVATGTGPRDGSPPSHVAKERRSRNVGWRSRDVVRAAALVMALYLGLRLLWFANTLVFVVFLGTLFGLAVARAVDYLERLHIRRGVASALVVFGTLAAIVGLGAIVAPTIREQVGELRRQLPQAVDRIEEWVNRRQGLFSVIFGRGLGGTEVASPAGAAGQGGADTPAQGAAPRPAAGAPAAGPRSGDSTAAQDTAPDAAATLRQRIGAQLSGATRYLFPFLSSTAAVLAGIVLVIFLAIYIGAEPKLYHDGLMHLFPHRTRKRAGEVLSEMAIVLRKWLVTQLIAMAVIGVVTTVVLLLLNVRAAFALGLIAGLLEFVPTVGPLLSAIPAIAMGFIDSPQKALYVALAYWGIQFLENNLLIPSLMRGGLDLPPAVTIIAQALMTLVFGFLGLMVAVPLTAAMMVPIKMLYVEDVVGDQISVRDTDDDDDDD
jgi:predicted PurR-regulated permease PerM